MWKDLAPDLIRQRIIIEGTTEKIVEPPQIKDYLLALSNVLGMQIRGDVLIYSAEDKGTNAPWSAINMGHGGWAYWVSSGVHFHSYPTQPPLFSVDVYTCKPFSIDEAIRFTREFLRPIEIVWKEISQNPHQTV